MASSNIKRPQTVLRPSWQTCPHGHMSLPKPTGLADGLGLEGTPLALARYTPKSWVPRPILRSTRRQRVFFCPAILARLILLARQPQLGGG